MTAQERDAWTLSYRLYEEYAPKLRQAAALADDNATACNMFAAIMTRIQPHFTNDGNGCNWILFGLYHTLEYVFKDAEKRRLERVQDERRGNVKVRTMGGN